MESSRHSNRERSERESDYGDRNQPIAIRRADSKRYHDHEGFSQTRDSTLDPVDSYDVPEPSGPRHGSHSTYSSQPPRARDDESSSDLLSTSSAKLTLGDVVGNPQYHHDILRGYVNNDGAQFQLSPSKDLDEDGQVGPYRDRGKNVARDHLPAPAAEMIPKHLIRGTRGQTEELDSSYAKRSNDYKKFFRPGRVFSTLWTGSYDDDDAQSENDQFMSRVTFQVAYKQEAFAKIRRFIVVRQADRSCTCLPVTTYDGRGYKKRGINLNDHGLIYNSRDPPAPIRGITKEPLRIILSKGAEKLCNPSYLNYGRAYTVETNVKVKDVGDLDTESRRLLRAYYREVHFRDFPDEDNYPPPGPSSNPQQRDVEVAGAGAAFPPAPSQQQYDSRGQYDRAGAGGYNQQQGWSNAGGFHPLTTNLYPATPLYPQPQSTTSGAVPAYHYADVPTYDMNRRSTSYQADSRYSQDDSAASGFSAQQVPAGHYLQNSDTHWAREPSPLPLFPATPAPVVSGVFHVGLDQGYESYDDRSALDTSQYLPPEPNYDRSQDHGQDAGWSPSSDGRAPVYGDITMPTLVQARHFNEAQATQQTRRKSSSRYSNRHRERYSDPRGQYRGSRDSKPVEPERKSQAQRPSHFKSTVSENHGRGSISILRDNNDQFQSLRPVTSPKNNPPKMQRTTSSRKQRAGADKQSHRTDPSHDFEGSHVAGETDSHASEKLRQETPVTGKKAVNALLEPRITSHDENHPTRLGGQETEKNLEPVSTAARSSPRGKSLVENVLGGMPPDGYLLGVREPAAQPQAKFMIRSQQSVAESVESRNVTGIASVPASSSLVKHDGAERLAAVLLGDEHLKSLYAIATQKISTKEFQDNFRRCLLQCSIHLMAEAMMETIGTTKTRTQALQCARAVRLFSGRVSTKIGSTLNFQNNPVMLNDHKDSHDVYSDDLDSHENLELPGSTLGLLQQSNINKGEADDLGEIALTMETILTSSIAFQLLRENIDLFLRPDPIKKALFESWPVNQSRDNFQEIQYDVSWMLPTFMKSGFAPEQELEDILILSGHISNAQAGSLGEYLVAFWPEFGGLLLEVIKNSINGVQNGKSRLASFLNKI